MGKIHSTFLMGNALEAEFKIGPHRQVGEQARFLKDIAQRPLVHRYEVIALAVLPDVIIDLYIGLAGAFETGDTTQTGGLARAGVTVEGGDPLARQLQVQVESTTGVAVLQPKVDLRRHLQLQPVCDLRLEYNASSTRKENTTIAPASQCA